MAELGWDLRPSKSSKLAVNEAVNESVSIHCAGLTFASSSNVLLVIYVLCNSVSNANLVKTKSQTNERCLCDFDTKQVYKMFKFGSQGKPYDALLINDDLKIVLHQFMHNNIEIILYFPCHMFFMWVELLLDRHKHVYWQTGLSLYMDSQGQVSDILFPNFPKLSLFFCVMKIKNCKYYWE